MLNQFDKSQVQRSFDLASGNYNQFASLQRSIGERLLAQQPLAKRKPTKVLDIGSGTGFLTAKLQTLYPRSAVTALDLSLGMLRYSQSLSAMTCKVSYLCGDAEQLPIGGESQSRVFSNLAFQWCPNLRAAFSECHRVLEKDGVFVFSTFGPNTLKELRAAWASADDGVHVNAFVSLKEIERLLKLAGFSRVALYTENIVLYYEEPKDVMRDLKGMGAHNVNHERRRGLTSVARFKKVQSAYEEKRNKSGLPATFQAIYGVCRR